ncbi:type I-C CRISPR-associated protein Cas7/Csd2 [Actinomadura syzygii]|uniref:Type I-C CRISPR-associated protein Cas7/Csd2 n=1 Tax=Actinomadura syzygii TaxID=1427538 RepID=A0A5D0TXJ3_9ACTN|nr:type I-C CRISPR-associated protein Cas7/Csd2 [Actinomadura syzygii]TYC10065.1 type I-C CRISPR-associated protein Cas7/Csd2 [Actinomadura syzygii]
MTVEAHLDPTRKQDFVLLFDVKDGNPNGDPDAGGMPRTDPETMQGLVTDVAIKRKIRNMVALLGENRPGYDIYVEAGVSLNSQHERAYTALGIPKSKDKSKDTTAQGRARDWMCQTFYDVRMFGAVMTTGSQQAGRVQGPVQLTFSRSIDPVLAQEHGITRVTRTKEEAEKDTEMGGKHAIPYGLYLGYGHFSAPLARKTGVTSDDLAMLWQSMGLMFEHDRASTRGEMTLRGLYVFSHNDQFGAAPSHTLFDLISVVRQVDGPARAFGDYTVKVDETIPDKVTLTRVVE